ncbi:MAG: hypothetical protein AB8G86_01530, partial [Saprospiraceae bacterium]
MKQKLKVDFGLHYTNRHYNKPIFCLLLLSLFFTFSLFSQPYTNVVINEISGDGGNVEAGNDAIVELAGPPGTNIGCMVLTNTEWAIVLPANTLIPADGIFLIGCEERNNASNGFYTGIYTGLSCHVCDFPGLVVDFDVCNDANSAYVSTSLYTTYGFTLDNQSCEGNTDGDQVILFRPDGTPHDAIYWGAADNTNSNGGGMTIGGASGDCGVSADHVAVQIGQAYTLGDNDDNGIINDYLGTHQGFKSNGGNALAVNFMPDGNDDFGNPEIEGITLIIPPGDCDATTQKYTVPPLSDPIWVNAGLALVSCNSTFIRINDTSPAGNSTQTAKVSTTSSHKDDPDLNPDWVAYPTNDLIPSSANSVMASNQWQITNHPNPSKPNDVDSWDFFYNLGAGDIEITASNQIDLTLCNPQIVTFKLKVYNYQHVEPTIRTSHKAGSFVRDETGIDQAWTINSVGNTVTTGGYPSANDGITTFTFTSNNLAAGNRHSFALVWDDYTDCCGSSNNNTVINQTNAHECYEKIEVNINVAEVLTVSDNEITCPEDFRTNVGLIDFSKLVTSPNAAIQYQLKEGVTTGIETMTGTLVETNTTGIFNLPNTLASNLALLINDLANCGADQVIRIGDACRMTPPCPNPKGAKINTNSVCPNEDFIVSLNAALSTNLPSSGTIDWYYGTSGFNPHNINERTLLGQSTITTNFPNVPTTGPFINEVLVDAKENDGNGGEFIEIAGVPGMDVGCFILTDGDDEIILPTGTVIPPDGFLLMASGKNTNAPAASIDIDLDNCNCFSDPMGSNNAADLQFTNHSATNGEFFFFYDSAGTFIDGILWGAPSVSGGNNHPDASAAHIIRTMPLGCTVPAMINRSGQIYVNVNVKKATNGISIELDEVTGNWQSTNDMGGSTPGATNSGALPISTVSDLVTSLDEDFCNQTIEISGIIQPATITGTCTETDITTVVLPLTINCPTAALQNGDKQLCLPINSSAILATVDLANGSGLYTTTIQLVDNTSIITFEKSNVNHPLQITYEDITTALGKTTFANLELSVVNISDANGTMCTGKIADEIIILTVQERPTAIISAATDLTDCSAATNGNITFEFSPTTNGPWEFEYSINEGNPILGAANTNSFTLPVSNAGIYELKSVSNTAGCIGTIGASNTQIVNAPSPLTLTAVNNITVCNNGQKSIDLNRDISITINNNGTEILGNATTLGNITWYASDPTLLPIIHRSLISLPTTVLNPTTEQDYYFIYQRPMDNCEIIGKTTVAVSSTACCQADAGDIILPTNYSSGTALCQGEDLSEFTVSYAATDETEPENTQFQYTFLLINSDSTIIQQTTGDFDFSNLAAGKYNVYGLSYANSNTPTNLDDYINSIKNDADKNDIAQIATNESSLDFCLNIDGLTESGHELIEILSPLTLISATNASLCNDGLHTIDLDTAITIKIDDNGTLLEGTAMTLGNITWYNSDPTLVSKTQRSTILLDTKVSPTMEQDYYFSYQRPADNCEIVGKTTVLLTNTLCCQADAGDIILPTNYSSGTALCQGGNLSEFTVSYTATDEAEPDNTEFQYTFFLTNSDSTIIQQTTGDFDFSNLAAGKYNIYGLSYANNNTPTNITDYLNGIKNDANENDIAQIATNESSLTYCLNIDGLTESGHELIEILSPLTLISATNAS